MAHVEYSRLAEKCPKATAFHKCAVGHFIGCCSNDPCDTGTCDNADNCNSSLLAGAQGPYAMSREQTTTLTVTVSRAVVSLTATTTVSDIITSMITETAAATIWQVATSSPNLLTLTSDVDSRQSSSETSSSSPLLTGSRPTENQVSSIHTPTGPTATTTITDSTTMTSSWMRHTSSATAIPPTLKGPHISTVVGSIVGGLSLLGLLALLLLCCCFHKRYKFSFSMKQKSKEAKERRKRAELLRKEEAALERQTFLGAAITTGAQSPVTGGTMDGWPSPYPRNSTAITPPQQWI